MVPGWNFYDNNSNTTDINGHGTKVAGVAAAIGNNAVGVTGGAWNAKIMPMRISSSRQHHLLQHGRQRIDLGRRPRRPRGQHQLHRVARRGSPDRGAIHAQQGRRRGVVRRQQRHAMIASRIPRPSSLWPRTDSADVRASWSAYGPIVDVAAPGVSICTTAVGGAYGAYNGTSFASPLTASVVALMLSANPALQPSQVDSILTSTADDLGAAGRDDYYGHGRINAARAVAAAKARYRRHRLRRYLASPCRRAPSRASRLSARRPATTSASPASNCMRAARWLPAIRRPHTASAGTRAACRWRHHAGAKAYDAAGNVASTTLNVTVANSAAGDTNAPAVQHRQSESGTTVNGNVAMTASAPATMWASPAPACTSTAC